MIAETLSRLWAASLAESVAILLVLALRRPLRRYAGVRLAYWLWLLVPLALLVSLAPPPPIMPQAAAPLVHPLAATASLIWLSVEPAGAAQTAKALYLPLVFYVWLAGAASFAAYLALGQHRAVERFGLLGDDAAGFTRAANREAGPALIGLIRPRLVIPTDFEQRFEPREQALILAHEQTHLTQGHLWINGITALIKILNWFNPLVHLGGFYALVDQELACDAAVVERFPGERRTYAQALLKSQLACAPLPLGCNWPGRSPNLLQERLTMLASTNPGRRRLLAGSILVGALCTGLAAAAWAVGPGETPSTIGFACMGASCAQQGGQNPTPRDPAKVAAAIKAGDVRTALAAGGSAGDVAVAWLTYNKISGRSGPEYEGGDLREHLVPGGAEFVPTKDGSVAARVKVDDGAVVVMPLNDFIGPARNN